LPILTRSISPNGCLTREVCKNRPHVCVGGFLALLISASKAGHSCMSISVPPCVCFNTSATTTATTSTSRTARTPGVTTKRAVQRRPRRRQAPVKPQVVVTRRANTQSRAIPSAVSTIRTNPMHSMIITHEEIVADVSYSGTPGPNPTFLINPRNSRVFPWLEMTGKAFDMYNFIRLEFYYVPSCGSTTQGSLVMAFDYDVTDDNSTVPFAALSAYAGAVSGQLYSPGMVCRYRPDSTVLAAHKYFSTTSQVPDRLSHCSSFVYALQVPATSTAQNYGKLWARYTVDLINPEVPAATINQASALQNQGKNSTTPTAIVPATTGSPIGTSLEQFMSLTQEKGLNTTQALESVAGYVLGHPEITNQLLTAVTKGGLSVSHPSLLTGWKAQHIVGDPVAADIGDVGDNIVITHAFNVGGDFLVNYRFEGVYAATDPEVSPSPLALFHVNNCTLAYMRFATPYHASDEPLMEGNNWLMGGYFWLHVVNPSLPAAFVVQVDPAYGDWTGVNPLRSWVYVMSAPHMLDGDD